MHTGKHALRHLLLSTIIVLALLTAGCRDRTPRLRPLPPQAVILAFGDSLTSGNGAAKSASYPAVLEDQTGMRTINAGRPGELSAAGRQRLPALLRRHQPDLVVLWHGGNDLLRRIDPRITADNLAAMIETVRSSGAQVLLLSVPQPGLWLRPAAFYRSVADRYQVPLEDEVLTRILRNDRLKSDAIHPNAAGYQELARAVAAMLRQD